MVVEEDSGTNGTNVDDAACGDFAHWASTDEGNPDKASLAIMKLIHNGF